jgi:protein-disulfide isomerase
MRSRALAFLALAFALIGLGASVASLFDYLAPAPQFCAESGCATVRASAWSHPLGVPLPAIGIVYFLAMSVLGFVSRRRTRLLLAAGADGAGGCIILMKGMASGGMCKEFHVGDRAAILGGLAVIAGAGTLRPTLPNIVATVPAAALVVLGLGLYAHREEPVAVAAANEPLPACVAKEQKPGQVTIVEFVDFQCPFCRALDKKLREALARTDKPVRIVRKMVPLPAHTYAVPAAMAWCSADAQGKGEEMAKELFATPPENLSPAGCEAIAVRLGCDLAKYRETFASAELRARIEQDVADAHAANLNGFPTIFIGAQKFEGANHSADTLLAAIERAGR